MIKTYEVFTDEYSVIVQARNISAALNEFLNSEKRKHDTRVGDIIAIGETPKFIVSEQFKR